MTSPSQLSDEALAAEWDKAAQEALAARQRAKELGAEVERRQVAAQAEDRLSALTDTERAALAQALHIQGIESGEAFGG